MIIELRDIGNTVVDIANVSMIRGRQEHVPIPCYNSFELAIGFDKITCNYNCYDGTEDERRTAHDIYAEDYNKIKEALLAKYDQAKNNDNLCKIK